MSIRLCAGVDPSPFENPEVSFSEKVDIHIRLIKQAGLKITVIKPNLAFFLAAGVQGLEKLQIFITKFINSHEIILDCKCNEIANSLEAWLHFAFEVLGVTGITINPFLGEKTIELALKKAIYKVGERARVYVLCATSESSSSGLSFLQEQPNKIIDAVSLVSRRVCSDDKKYQFCMGVVVGANRSEVLSSSQLEQSGLSVLAPGLGAQGASFEITNSFKAKDMEVTFPISRAIFEAGEIDFAQVEKNFNLICKQLF